jgi:hypothetical protein
MGTYKMNKTEFEKKLYRRIAQVSIGASAIRNQGGSGLIKILRDYFETEINPSTFFKALPKKKSYRDYLDYHTDQILKRFPKGAKSWGGARKGLNLFLRDFVYNGYFGNKYNVPTEYSELNSFIKYLEVPLDKEVAHGIIQDCQNEKPKWTNIRRLTPEISEIFQEQAEIIANQKGTARVNLDLIYWRSDKSDLS